MRLRSNWFGKKGWENIHGHEVYFKIICSEKFVLRICCEHLYVTKFQKGIKPPLALALTSTISTHMKKCVSTASDEFRRPISTS